MSISEPATSTSQRVTLIPANPTSQVNTGICEGARISNIAQDELHDSNHAAQSSDVSAHAPGPRADHTRQRPGPVPARPYDYAHRPRGPVHPQGNRHHQHTENASKVQQHGFSGRPHTHQGYSNGYRHADEAAQAPSFQPHHQQAASRPSPHQPGNFHARPELQRPARPMNNAHNLAQHERARPVRREAHDRHRAPQTTQGSSDHARTSGSHRQHEPEPSHITFVAEHVSTEPSLASLSIAGHTNGQAGQSSTGMRRAKEPGRHQMGTARQSMRGAPQHQQRTAVLAEHTEEHLARLLENSRQAGALQLSSSGTSHQARLPSNDRRFAAMQRAMDSSSHPAKRRGQPQRETLQDTRGQPAGQSREQHLRNGTEHADYSEEHGTCVICAEQRQIVAVGLCNHKAVCARCCLRMRLKYKDMNCPLCKQDQVQVIMTAWKGKGVPDWEQLQSKAEAMWQKPSWAKGVLVDSASCAPGSQELFRRVQDITAYSCVICDPEGGHPKPSMKVLQQHMLDQHHRQYCKVCVEADTVFPTELGHFARDKLAEHEREHPHCEFCNIRVYSGDDLFEHMRSLHFTCDVCQRNGSFVHFDNRDTLVAHLRKEHHLCEEPECEYCFVAYNTAEELRQHRVQVHSRGMPRFDRSRARLLDLSDAFPSHSGLPSHPRSREATGRADRQTQGRQHSRQNGTPSRGPPVQEAVPTHAQDGGIVMIDDDLGMSAADFPDMPGAANAPRSGPSSRAASQARPRQADDHQEEAFPELRAQTADSSTAAQEARPPPVRRPQPPPLQKVTLKCPCGRRLSHTAVPAGQRPGILTCDAECERQKRSSRLASAFGIEDPAHHVPWVDRQPRDVHWSAELLHYAWHNRAKVQAMEAQLEDFAGSAQKRRSLPSMPKQERHIMHQLTDSYGLATQSFGAEPARHIDIFKVASAGLPRILLSQAAAASTLDELERALRTEKGFSVVFTDVSPSVDLHRILYQWEGQFVLNGPFPDGEATARFTSPEAAKEALDMLGGGVRGQYRVNRAVSWNAAAIGSQRRSEGPAQPAQPAQVSRVIGSNSRLPQQRPHGLPVGPAALPRFEMPKQPEQAGQHRVSDPRAFRASDLAFLEPSPAGASKPSSKRGARGILAESGGIAGGHSSHDNESWEDSI